MPSAVSAGRKDGVPFLLLPGYCTSTPEMPGYRDLSPGLTVFPLIRAFEGCLCHGGPRSCAGFHVFSPMFGSVLLFDFGVLHQGSLENQPSLPTSVSVFS